MPVQGALGLAYVQVVLEADCIQAVLDKLADRDGRIVVDGVPDQEIEGRPGLVGNSGGEGELPRALGHPPLESRGNRTRVRRSLLGFPDPAAPRLLELLVGIDPVL